MEAYGKEVKEVVLWGLYLPDDQDDDGGSDGGSEGSRSRMMMTTGTASVSSLLRRRPRLTTIMIKPTSSFASLFLSPRSQPPTSSSLSSPWLREATSGLTTALAQGLCNDLQSLHLIHHQELALVFHFLSDPTTCPHLAHLHLALCGHPDDPQVISLLASALQLRIKANKGWKGLMSLHIKPLYPLTRQVFINASDLSPLLSSGACETLEELVLPYYVAPSRKDPLVQWMERSRAPLLYTLDLGGAMTPQLINTLSADNVAPNISSLHVSGQQLEALSDLIETGKWEGPRELIVSSFDPPPALPRLFQALNRGGCEVQVLRLSEGAGQLMEVLVQAIYSGSFPRLEELDVSGTAIGDYGVAKLAEALEADEGFSNTLQRLDLSDCQVSKSEDR